jgi:nitroreductase
MEKPADNQYPIHDLVRRRWSPRAFAERAVEPDRIQSLFEAARWAASAFNEQPWRFLIASREHPAEFQRMLECLVEGNRVWAQYAPLIGLTVVRTELSRNDRPNRNATHDLGLAMGNLSLQATALGLAVHQMGGVHHELIRSKYDIPDAFEPVNGFAVGYPGDADQLTGDLLEAELEPRTRRPIDEIVYAGSWGDTSSFLDGDD